MQKDGVACLAAVFPTCVTKGHPSAAATAIKEIAETQSIVFPIFTIGGLDTLSKCYTRFHTVLAAIVPKKSVIGIVGLIPEENGYRSPFQDVET